MIAVARMDPGVQAVLYLIAVVLFVLAAIGVTVNRVNLIAAGLAFVAFVWFWNALAAS